MIIFPKVLQKKVVMHAKNGIKGFKMGLASSQARLLNITARMHQIEYKAQRLEAMKLQMANESAQVYEDYQDALDAIKVQFRAINSDGSTTYKDITEYADLTGAGFHVYCVEENSGTTTYKEFVEGSEFETSMGKINVSKLTSKILENFLQTGIFVLAKRPSGGSISSGSTEEFKKFIDEELTSVATHTGLREISDETDLKKAEAKYEADMKRIDLKDRKYDTDLAALESERNALKQEMDTLKTVAHDNVERTFKLFS